MHCKKNGIGSPKIIVPAAVATLAVFAACQDANAPTRNDEWASTAVETFHIRNEARLPGADGKLLSSAVSQHRQESGHPLPVVDLPQPPGKGKHYVRFAHARSKSGERITNAFVYGAVKQPPKRVYGFKDGKVQFVFVPKYKKVGQSWIREHARVSLYDDAGKVIAEFDSRSVHGPAPSNPHAAAAGAFVAESVAFDGLGGNEVEGACWRELADNLTAYAVMVAASYAAVQATASCPPNSPISAVCGPIASAAVAAALTAFNKYMHTMDALTLCELRAWINETNSGSSAPPDRATEVTTALDIIAVIQEFIRQAVAAGTFWCNDSGTYCVYTGSQQL